MKIKLQTLRRVILEELDLSTMTGLRLTPQRLLSALNTRGFIFEDQQPLSLDHEEIGASLDEQVDRYLAQYENSAKQTDSASIGEVTDWNDDVRSFLTEADEEETEKKEADVQKPKKLSATDIDVEDFANNIARLVENYDSLLEVKNTLVRRAVNFISDHYDDDVVKLLKGALKQQHGLMIGKSKIDIESEDFKAPKAGAAGPGGGA